jgi:hypothetical protein
VQCEAVYHLVKQRDLARLAQLGDRLCRRAQRLAVGWLRTRGHATLAAELETRWQLAR